MPIALLDTSALVKRYRPAEAGSQIVLNIFNNPAYRKTILSLTIVELFNILYRLKRENHITQQTLTETLSAFYSDIFHDVIHVHSIRDEHIFHSERIIEKAQQLPIVKWRRT